MLTVTKTLWLCVSRHALAWACAAVCIATHGCAQHEEPAYSGAPQNVVLIVVDTMRADHLGCYGYTRDTSPVIDEVAAQGVVFDSARTNSTYTGEAMAAMLSGMPPTLNPLGTGWYARPHPDVAHNLAQRLRAAGYRTGLFTDTPVLTFDGFADGFDEAAFFTEGFGAPAQSGEVTRAAIDFARAHRDEKHLLYVHYIQPHHPYDPPAEYVERIAGGPVPEKKIRLHPEVKGRVGALRAEGFGPGEARFEDLVLRYDADIAVADAHIGMLLDALRAQGTLENTLVIITADHGEEFLEHDYVEHAWTLYDEVARVPLIFWAPGLFEAQRVADHVSLDDLLPTVLRLAGLDYDADRYYGEALFTATDGAWAFRAPEKPVVSQLLTETRSLLHTVVRGNLKYLAAARFLTPEQCEQFFRVQRPLRAGWRAGVWRPFDYWSPPVHEALYDLDADPGETRNLALERPEDLAAMRAILAGIQAKSVRDPDKTYAQQDALSMDYAVELERIGLTEPGRKPLPEELRDPLEALGYFGIWEDAGADAPAPPDPDPEPAELREELPEELRDPLEALGYFGTGG